MAPRTPLNPENDLEGYDEAQRAEIHEYEGGGPVDGLLRTDMSHDRGGDLDEELDGEAAELPDGFQEVADLASDDADDEDDMTGDDDMIDDEDDQA